MIAVECSLALDYKSRPLTALGEEVDDSVNLTTAVDVLELCGTVEGEIVNTQPPLTLVCGV